MSRVERKKHMFMEWRIGEKAPAEFAQQLSGYPALVADLLWQRGVRTAEEAQVFLHPEWEKHVHDPFLFKNMKAVVARIYAALEKNERIVIHGDYDADGVTGSSVLYETLRLLATLLKSTADFSVYIPHRETEGYGLNMKTVERFATEGVKLIITVDCGIASVAETDKAHELGMDVIVVDHHAMPPKLSDHALIIHPQVPGETYPFAYLAAVGVAYKVACALLAEGARRGLAVPFGFEKWLLDFVGIATVTDMVPLIGENRVLERFGLTVLQKTRREGLRALYRVADVDPARIDTTTIGFRIGPRINAAGRMRHARLAFELLTSLNPGEADVLAAELQQANTDRQREVEKMVETALQEAESQRGERVICLAKQDWQHGLIGLVASRLVNTYGVPAYVVGITERGLVGSGRSIPGFHATDALALFKEHLLRFGGHPQACGFSVKDEASLQPLFDGLRAHARTVVPEQAALTRAVDAEVRLPEVTMELVETLQLLEPYGERNAQPVFLARGVIVQAFATMGETKRHARLTVLQEGARQTIVAFGMAGELKDIPLGAVLDVAVQLAVNEWQGRRSPQLTLVAWKMATA